MRFKYRDSKLQALADFDGSHTAGWDPAIVRKFRERVTYIKNANDERDFYALKSLRFERLDGNRAHQHSIRLNKQWRLILELDKSGECTVVEIVEITDYH